MKLTRIIAAALILAAASTAALAQQPARPASPAASSPSAAGGGQIAVIDIQAFGDQKAGIARLISAYATLEREFTPRRDELQRLKARYDQLGKEYEQIQKAPAQPDSLTKKADEIQNLEKEMKRKQEDAQQAVERREQELTAPVWEDINTALRAFAAQRGISIILEKSKLAGNGLMFVVNDNMDITRAFIAEYNQRNPASTAAAPTSR